jgi:hypothetical protein
MIRRAFCAENCAEKQGKDKKAKSNKKVQGSQETQPYFLSYDEGLCISLEPFSHF